MSLQIHYETTSTPVSCFADTLEEAKTLATQKAAELTAQGHLVTLDDKGFLMRDGLYAWNVYAMRITYR